MGNYHGTAPGYVTILEGIRQAAGGRYGHFLFGGLPFVQGSCGKSGRETGPNGGGSDSG